MDSQLQSISKLFTEKLYRIPDYQRGYAWTERQLRDFWGDLMQLDEGKDHYVGVLTLEKVPKNIYCNWEDDIWIINSRSYEPFYVVDGQQRLTTTIILIQAILEVTDHNQKLNYTSIEKIKERYIYESKDEGISRSYIFGYEKDNPSYEFLKTKIFNEVSSSAYLDEETIYTHNLEFAKSYFIEKLKELNKSGIEQIYKKVTQHLLFNIYSISADIDVFVTFETMNNRGKPLSKLELLKNRLIYLSTKFDVIETERTKLRKTINDCWKAIYHNLGKNKDNPLKDDLFLQNHFIMYFGKEVANVDEMEIFTQRRVIHPYYRDNYIDYLLEKKFTPKNIEGTESQKIVGIKEVYEYSENLQQSVLLWYDLFNPSQSKALSDEEKVWVDKIGRIGIIPFAPLLLTVYLQKPSKDNSVKLLKCLERYAFVMMLVTYRFGWHPMEFQGAIQHITNGKSTVVEITKVIQERLDEITKKENLVDILIDRFKRGFYDWEGVKYFMYEYEISLKDKTKTKREKINWLQFMNEADEFVTIEHIFPQTPKLECWQTNFSKFTPKEKKILQDSLGNLLPLSRAKNSSLQNKCFSDKLDNNDNQIGYRYGSYSENEISKLEDWKPIDILQRGIKLLEFIESRWGLTLGDNNKKIEILNLKSLLPKIM
ncbi:MAG TPA: DUF262 domain-containing HNH endonuclease family protein [Chitinophagales bacterium]|nr:DUF262 domain-containing HNH endonuclease family protein [Chitinophagales bacterium]